MEAQPKTPEAPIEMRDEQADTADATAAIPIKPITLRSTIASSSQQVTLQEPFLDQPITPLMHFTPILTPIFSQGFDISDLLSFDPATMGLTALGAKVPSSQQSANLADQLQLIKDLLSAPINTLVDDSTKIKEILEQIVIAII